MLENKTDFRRKHFWKIGLTEDQDCNWPEQVLPGALLELEAGLVLDGHDEDPALADLPEEADHGRVLPGGVGVEHAAGHDLGRGLVEDEDVDAAALGARLRGVAWQDLRYYGWWFQRFIKQ